MHSAFSESPREIIEMEQTGIRKRSEPNDCLPVIPLLLPKILAFLCNFLDWFTGVDWLGWSLNDLLAFFNALLLNHKVLHLQAIFPQRFIYPSPIAAIGTNMNLGFAGIR